LVGEAGHNSDVDEPQQTAQVPEDDIPEQDREFIREFSQAIAKNNAEIRQFDVVDFPCVEHTWQCTGPLGFILKAIDANPEAPGGAVISEITQPSMLPKRIQAGLVLKTVAGEEVEGISFNDTIAKIRGAGRPVTMSFVPKILQIIEVDEDEAKQVSQDAEQAEQNESALDEEKTEDLMAIEQAASEYPADSECPADSGDVFS